MWYNLYFTSVWSTGVLAVPATVALVALGIRHVIAVDTWHTDATSYAFLTSACAVALWAVYLRLHSSRVSIRSQSWPACWPVSNASCPETEEDLIEAVCRAWNSYGRPPTVVGGGWGFFITRSKAHPPVVFMHRYRGRVDACVAAATARWKAGTTIAELAHALKNDNLALSTHPTMDYISVGAWFARGNHGNGGDVAFGSSKTLKSARMIDMTQRPLPVPFEVNYKQLRHRFDEVFDGHDTRRYCVLDVTLMNLVPNAFLQKTGIEFKSDKDACEWLKPGAKLRVCFQGAARDHALGVRWEAVGPSGPQGHLHPHLCSRFCQYIQSDICSIFGGCYHKPIERWGGYVSHYDANRWMPLVWPLESVAVVLSGFRNFEVVFKLDVPLTPSRMMEMLRTIICLHKKIGGRSEIRHGGCREPVFLDIVLRGNFESIFQMLARPPFGVCKVALHPGKMLLPTSPCRKVSLADMYGF